MLRLIKGLLLALLVVHAAAYDDHIPGDHPTPEYYNVHLFADGIELRQCMDVASTRFAEFNIRHVCLSTAKESSNYIACYAGGRNKFSIMERFIAACDAAQGNLVKSTPVVTSASLAKPTPSGKNKGRSGN
ncbi:hypothetical protein ACQY0O_003443 [Thecaphora frezii]